MCVWFFFSIKYRYILSTSADNTRKRVWQYIEKERKIKRYFIEKKLHLSRLFCCNHTCHCVNMVSVTSASRYITSASRYHPRYQSISSIYIRGLIPQISRNWPRQYRLGQNVRMRRLICTFIFIKSYEAGFLMTMFV